MQCCLSQLDRFTRGGTMPWKASEATRHDKKAKSAVSKRQWADVANSVLQKTGNEGQAIREANSVIRKRESASYTGKASGYSHTRPQRKVINRYAGCQRHGRPAEQPSRRSP